MRFLQNWWDESDVQKVIIAPQGSKLKEYNTSDLNDTNCMFELMDIIELSIQQHENVRSPQEFSEIDHVLGHKSILESFKDSE